MLNKELVNDFIEEALIHISTVEKKLLQLVKDKNDVEAINEIFRAVHSIKGTAGFFKLDKIVNLSHSMENLFGKIRNNDYKLCEEDIDILLSSNDFLKMMIDDIDNSENVELKNITQSLEKISNRELKKIHENELNIMDTEKSKAIGFNISEEIIQNAKRRGHSFYEIVVNIQEDLIRNDQTPKDLIKVLESIGELIDSHINNKICSNTININEGTMHILISSVLEKSLISLAVNLEENKIFDFSIEDYIQNIKITSKEIQTTNNVYIDENLESEKSKEQGVFANGLKTVNGFYKEESVRVKVSLLNELLNLTGELVLGRNQLLRAMENHKNDIHGVDRVIQNIDHITSNLQGKIMQTRMQPLGNIFDKFPRIIRDLSKSLNKEINLEMEGSEVELDKSIIEVLVDPLVHLVRNAADHGLESSKERSLSGKSSCGTIKLHSYYKSGFVMIDVIDDGRGIDLEKVRKKALQKDIISSEELLHMTEKEIMELILKPGFSTSENITNISGRGVGMDVVKTNIKKMGGNIEIYSVKGKETKIRLIIPLTLAIISALIIESNNQKFALPQINIKEIVRILPKDKYKKLEYINGFLVLRLREKLVPIVTLDQVLGLETPNIYNENKIIRILILKIGFKEFGLMVDEIYDSEEILVKPLPKYIKDSECYSGVTILGDGRVSMILDINSIAEKAKLRLNNEIEMDNPVGKYEEQKLKDEQKKIILFKCSEHETFALEVAMVKRVEEIENHDIELIGSKEYVKIRNNALRVIRPSNYIPISKSQNTNEKCYIIIPKMANEPVGILIDKIYDTIEANISLTEGGIKLKGTYGSIIMDNKIVLLLKLSELLAMALEGKYEE